MAARAARPWSLRRRMAIAIAVAACMVFLILGFLVYRAVASSTAAQFDETLQQQAALALRYADHEYEEGESVVPRPLAATARAMPFDVVYQITTGPNQLLYRSPGSPQAPLAIGSGPGYSNAVLDGRSWRVYSLSSATTALVIPHRRAARIPRCGAVAHAARSGSAAALCAGAADRADWCGDGACLSAGAPHGGGLGRPAVPMISPR